ncbi:MAG TPA: hypothetical protein VFI54_06360 [Solirubrobacteraceae bacterium]|nr:hypothetical protein [Solirubrobacteraceae bacterium]
MNVVEFARFVAMLIIAGAIIRWAELSWGGKPGIRGQVAEGLGVVY